MASGAGVRERAMDVSKSAEEFKKALTETDLTFASLEGRVAGANNLDIKFAEIQKKFDQAAAITDEQKREFAMKVLKAELEQIRLEAAKEEVDLAQAMVGLSDMFDAMGGEYAQLSQLTPEEQGLIDTAKTELKAAEDELVRAEAKWDIFNWRTKAIAKAKAHSADAKTGISNAEVEANKRARQRLMKATIEQSLQEYMLRVDRTITIMSRRMEQIQQQVKNVSVRKDAAQRERISAAQKIESLDKKLNAKESDLRQEEELLIAMQNGSPDYDQQAAKISKLRAEVEEVRGERNVAFAVHQSKEKFATELEVHEMTQIKLRDNQKMWIASLKSDTEERVVTFRSRLEAMKSASDQEVAKKQDDLGQAIDRENAKNMAMIGSASDNIRMEKIEKHAERLKAILASRKAQAEAQQAMRVREQAELDKFRKRYGIDPDETSFFHYEEKPAGEGSPNGSGAEKEPEPARMF